jgi:N-acetylglucosaminyldiphosphoundecaprenol N-acetyl-beta-D-mannosaminyltransferase
MKLNTPNRVQDSEVEKPLSIMAGLPFHPLAQGEAIEECMRMMDDWKTHYLVTANSDFAAQADKDPELKQIVFNADRILCDGQPLVWFSRWFNCPVPERVAGSDLVAPLLGQCAAHGKRVFFMGTSEENLDTLTQKLNERFPTLKIAGTYAPPVGAIEDWDNPAIIRRIKAADPHLLLVALGCPKQEKWISRFAASAGVPLSNGVGASLDFITGRQIRAPRWVQRAGLEWFWRLIHNPTRLFQRYARDAWYLLKLNFRQWISVGKARPVQQGEPTPQTNLSSVSQVMVLSGDVDAARIPTLVTPAHLTRPLVVECSAVRLLDSSGIGYLVQLSRIARQSGQPICLLNPSKAVSIVVKTVKLETQLPMVHSNDAAWALIKQRQAPGKTTVSPFTVQAEAAALDAYNITHLEERILEVSQQLAEGRIIDLDLSQVPFIDSSAVGRFIHIKKALEKRQQKIRLSHLNKAVDDTLRLLRLHSYFVSAEKPEVEPSAPPYAATQ